MVGAISSQARNWIETEQNNVEFCLFMKKKRKRKSSENDSIIFAKKRQQKRYEKEKRWEWEIFVQQHKAGMENLKCVRWWKMRRRARENSSQKFNGIWFGWTLEEKSVMYELRNFLLCFLLAFANFYVTFFMTEAFPCQSSSSRSRNLPRTTKNRKEKLFHPSFIFFYMKNHFTKLSSVEKTQPSSVSADDSWLYLKSRATHSTQIQLNCVFTRLSSPPSTLETHDISFHFFSYFCFA